MDQQNISLNSIPTPPADRTSRLIKIAFGYLFALACLFWVFHDVRFGGLLRSMITIHWGWVALAVVFDILSYICQGARWKLLLQSIGAISVLRATQAIYAGLFTNEVLPLRIGELVRAYLVSRWLYTDFVTVTPSMVVERLFDGIWLALTIGFVAVFVPLPRNLLEAEETLGAGVLVATGFFLYLVFRKRKVLVDESYRETSIWKPLRTVKLLINRFIFEFQKIGISSSFYISFVVSLLILFFQILAFWLVMWAYGLKLSFWIGAVVFLIVHLGTAIPNAPANVGTYQFFCVVGLSLFGIEKTLAAGFSLAVFIILTVPLWIVGMVAVSHTGMSLAAIRSGINRLLQKAQTEKKEGEIIS